MKIQNTFVLCAEDCPVDHAVVPQEKSGKPTVDFLLEDDTGQRFVFMVTGALLKSIPC